MNKTDTRDQLIDSWFSLYDLIKITSRKAEVQIITFYFWIPLFKNYSMKSEESLTAVINNTPRWPIWSHHNFIELSVVFKFFSPELA